MYLMSSTDDEGDLLSARGLKAIGTQKVAELMRVSVHVEKPHESIPGVTVGTLGGPMYDLVQLITNTLNETGRVLVDTGYPDLGSFVIEALKEGAKAKATPDAEVDTILDRVSTHGQLIVDHQSFLTFHTIQLVRAIPGFRDMAIVDSQRASKSITVRYAGYLILNPQQSTVSRRHSF